jgi:hypothetical protein
MSRLGRSVLGVALLAMLSVSLASAADEEEAGTPTPPSGGKSWRDWFGSSGKGEEEKPAAAEGAKPAAVDRAAVVRAREEAALLRRQEVCCKLKEIALQTNDPELERRAQELEERAWEVYNLRTAHLPQDDAGFEETEPALGADAGTRARRAARTEDD